MCVNSYQHFAKCDHVCATLTTCPTYHKQQDAAKGIFGSLFRRSLRKKKNCGKVVPHYLENEAYCQACSVKKERLRAQGVGQGALKVRRQGFQEIFQEERKEAARNALHRSEKRRRRGSKQSNHDVIHVESSIWINDLYHHPETLARKEAYAREAAPAPPVSRHQTTNHPRGAESRPRGPSTHERRGGKKARETESRGEWMPAYGSVQPMIRPAQPAPAYRYSGRFSNRTPSLPPAVGLPPRPQHSDQSFAARAEAAGYPDLRRKPGRVHDVAGNHNRQQVYLDRTGTEAAVETRRRRQQQQQQQQQPRPPPRNHVGHWRVEDPSQWETAISDLIEKAKERASLTTERDSFTDEDSDDSFVCKTSQAISNHRPRSTGERSRHRK
ncbi:hypothetical protein F4823DRAFT_172318 [Ustulina deusta]|nr:hypothetical protein F4823DRAFT_172318 [Ustulina deusta]